MKMGTYEVFKPKKTRYKLLLVYLSASVALSLYVGFIRPDIPLTDKENSFFLYLSLGFPVLIGYYLWREYEDGIHTEKRENKRELRNQPRKS